MPGPELMSELIARLERDIEEGRSYQIALQSVTIERLVAAAKERDQLRAAADLDEAARLRIEAANLRERATLKAWSGSLAGLEAAEAASARAAALEALAGLDSPTYEQQRDAAMTKLAAVLVERNQLRAQLANTTALYAKARHDGSTVAVALGLDGWECSWGDVAPRIERLCAERDQLRAEVERLRGLGLEAARIAARAEVTRNDILRAEDLIAEIERNP